jgi:histidinol-phosphate aminotransferase
MKMLPINSQVETLLPYSVPTVFEGIKLNQNEAPLDLPLEIKEAILNKMKNLSWHHYPGTSPVELIQAISAYTGFDNAGILVGNGSNELIQTALLASCQKGDTLVTVSPTFSVYSRVAAVMGLNLKEVPLKEDFSFDVEKLLKESWNASCIIIASPNNPTGTILSINDIKQIAANTDRLLVIDEAYFEFHGKSAQGLIEEHRNLVILRTFSKALASAGVRLGYLLAHPALTCQLEKVKLPFSIGLFQQVAGLEIIKQREWLNTQIETTIAERDRVYRKLMQMDGIDPVQ